MLRFVMPIILIAISIAIFLGFTRPLFDGISTKKAEVASYNEALNNSKALEDERDKLALKYNGISEDNRIKLQKLLPDNIDNIRLILEIEQVAMPYGMVLKNVRYNTAPIDDPANETPLAGVGQVQGGSSALVANSDYGSWDLAFSTTGTYNNFINFTKDLESNLRIVDVSSVEFSSDAGGATVSTNVSTADSYTYNFKIKTYWLKN